MKKLTKHQRPLFAFSAFGPNLLMIFISAYLIDALIPTGFVKDREFWSFTGAVVVSPIIFSVFFTIAKIIDGLIDIPLASLTDNLRTKWGRRRPAIAIAFLPMIISYYLIWNPPVKFGESIFNTLYIAVLLLIFFSSYTMSVISYYASFSTIVENEKERVKLSSWKSFFDTIGYSLAYALLPMFISFGLNIKTIVMCTMPLMLTMLIPLFLIKEGEKYQTDENFVPEEKIPLLESLKLTLKNKQFVRWLFPLAALHFGLMMFLAGQNVMASGVMELTGWQITIINTAAFAPVPLMLVIFNIVQKKKGLRFAFQTSLIAFAFAMLVFNSAWVGFWPGSYIPRLIIAIIGGTIGSYSIGAFFAFPYIIPSQIAANEQKATGKNHTAMYFAVQGLVVQVSAAISTGIVYINVKNITTPNSEIFGIFLVPFIVAIACLLAFALSFRMPKNYSQSQDIVDTLVENLSVADDK